MKYIVINEFTNTGDTIHGSQTSNRLAFDYSKKLYELNTAILSTKNQTHFGCDIVELKDSRYALVFPDNFTLTIAPEARAQAEDVIRFILRNQDTTTQDLIVNQLLVPDNEGITPTITPELLASVFNTTVKSYQELVDDNLLEPTTL